MKKNLFSIAIIAIVAIGSFLLGNKFMFVKAEKTFSFKIETTDEFYKKKHLWPVLETVSLKAICARLEYNNLNTQSEIRNMSIGSGIYPDSFSKFVSNPKISLAARVGAFLKENDKLIFADGKREGMAETFKTINEYYLCEP